MRILKERKGTWIFSYAYFEGMELLGHSPIGILKEWSYLDILLYVFRRNGELLGHYPMLILKERRVTWTFSYAYFEGTESYLVILLCVF